MCRHTYVHGWLSTCSVNCRGPISSPGYRVEVGGPDGGLGRPRSRNLSLYPEVYFPAAISHSVCCTFIQGVSSLSGEPLTWQGVSFPYSRGNAPPCPRSPSLPWRFLLQRNLQPSHHESHVQLGKLRRRIRSFWKLQFARKPVQTPHHSRSPIPSCINTTPRPSENCQTKEKVSTRSPLRI